MQPRTTVDNGDAVLQGDKEDDDEDSELIPGCKVVI